MPQIFKFGPYYVYFWSNENDPYINAKTLDEYLLHK